MSTSSQTPKEAFPFKLPQLNCGACGYRTCEEFAAVVEKNPSNLKRCIYLDNECRPQSTFENKSCGRSSSDSSGCCTTSDLLGSRPPVADVGSKWRDSLGREFDFYLEHFPEDPGPREIIIPHNPMITRELNVKLGDVLIGRPLGMSCGCPITHCGEVIDVDLRTGVITWCVTGPLKPRESGYKDLGYYIAEGYEGIITEPKVEIKIGMRYYFQPRMCMLQWRHSGLVNYMNKTVEGLQVRLEGLWIG
ncbi:MAG: Fe-S cluster protein [Oligoflexia bacterium]|nr:Fe-S cluster protein [Oligoflexia bacterium]